MERTGGELQYEWNSPPTVLLIRDYRTEELDSTRALLLQFGYGVQTASGGREGLGMAVAQPPALILTDIILPDLGGIELCSLIRAEPKLHAVPILLAGRVPSDSFSVREGLNAGADDYIAMPCSTMSLLAKTARLVERRRAEEKLRKQLMQAQKMEAIGQLAGGVAHDFANLLTIIGGYSDLTYSQLEPAHPLRRYIGEIRKAAKYAKTLTRQLLTFDRRQVLQPLVIDLNTIITESASLISHLIGESIQLKTVLAADLGSVKADPGQVEQMILNLVVNARNAMPNGGDLTIETRNIYLDASYPAAPHFQTKPGDYVMMAVSDTGCGISEANRTRIFEPFLTAKEVNKGTGLVLSTVYEIVKQSEGYIWVCSEVERGTTFKIYLPRVNEKPVRHQRRVEVREAAPCDKTVMIVEDEEMLRNLVREMLESLGYHVIVASRGKEAISHCRQHAAPIDLLLTDVAMPEMSGRALAEELRKTRPEIRVVYMSGYATDAILEQGVIDGEAHFIEKPFSKAALARKLHEILL